MHYKLHTLLRQLSGDVLYSITEELNNLDLLDPSIQLAEVEEQRQEQLVQSLVAMYTNEKKLATLYRKLSAIEQKVLTYFLFYVHADFLTFRQIESLTDPEPILFRRGLFALARKGIIYTIRRQWGEVAYVLPTDLANLFYNYYLQDLQAGEGQICLEKVSSSRDLPPPFYVIIYLILDELRAEVNMSVPLTQKGSIHKRYIRNWQEKWMKELGSLEGLKLSFAHRETYSTYMALILDFLTRQKIIRWYKQYLRVDENGAERWMNLTREEMVAEFLRYWSAYIKPSTPWLVRYQLDMLRQKPGEWVYLLSFIEIWEENYSLPNIADLQQQLREEILDPLLSWGLIERGQTEQGEEVWRWRKEEEHQSTVWIEGTTGLYCPSVLPFKILWKLGLILEIEAWEYTLLFTLSEKKLQVALAQGLDLDLWLTWLQTLVHNPLPQDFIEQIQHWRKNREQILIQSQTVIEIKDLALAEAWLEWPEVRDLPLRRIQPSLFLISKDHETFLTELFSRRGFPLQEKVEVPPVHEKELDVTLIEFAQDKLQYKVESIFPQLTDAVPAWGTFPELWKKQLAAYHEQSRRRIIEEALKHHLHLRIELRETNVLEIIPRSLRVEDGHWICYDQHNNLYPLEQITKLQLLFPV